MCAELSSQKNNAATGKPVFSILIPSWNNLPYLRLCIESIFKNSHFNHQVIVHVNEGKDGTLDWIKSQNTIEHTYTELNEGVCYALNHARSLAETDYIVYMNDDMYVCPNWDLELYNEIQSIGHTRFFLSSTMIEPAFSNNDCVIVKDYGKDMTSFKEEELLNNFSTMPKADWQGATWPPNIVHREIWDLVDGYSIEFSPGMNSDPDFSMKLWTLGIRLFKGVGKSRVYHFGCKTTGRIKHNEGSRTFFSKWGISSSTLTNYYLRRGKPFTGPLSEPVIPKLVAMKNSIKKIAGLFRSK